jgi:queuosine biosynthesis protein QueC
MDAVVLLSGGIDSTTCLAYAVQKYGHENVVALCVHYGQKHEREINCARDVAEHYGVELVETDLSSAFQYSKCTLLEGNSDMEHRSYGDQLADMGGSGIVDTYVPFRNGLMLSYAAAIAVSKEAKTILYGAHSDDAVGGAYPDCTPEFYNSMTSAIYSGTGGQIMLQAPLLSLNKTQVVELGLQLKAPYHLTWSCYEGGEHQCGTCATCIDRKLAFVNNGVKDPVAYEI